MGVLAVLGPLLLGLWWCFSLFAAFDLEVLVVSGLELVVFLVATRGGAESFLVVSFLLMVSMAPWLCGSSSLWRRLASLRSATRSALVLLLAVLLFFDGSSHCIG